MKKIILILFFLILPTVVFAEDELDDPSPTPINVGQVIRERNKEQNEIKKEIREQTREEHKEQIQAKLQEKNQNRIRSFYGRLSKRMTAAIERLQTLSERILNRLSVLGDEGEDVSSLEGKVEEAQGLLEDAQGLLTNLEGMMEQMLASDDPKSFMPTLKDAVMEIKDTLKASHSILVEVITQIKGLRIGNTESTE